VNRRPVRDPQLRAALRVAYRELIPRGRHPAAALFLDIPPEAVDVNVHPMKTELRFRDAEGVRGLLISALRRALAVGVAQVPGAGPEVAPLPAPTHALAGFAEALPPPPSPPSWSMPVPGWRPQPATPRLPLGFAPAPLPQPGPPQPVAAEEGPLGRPVAQLFATYILAEAPDGALVLVDQHAAHERLTHEALLAQLAAGGVRTQPLLLPEVVELPAPDVARLLEAAAALARLGLEIEGFGPGAVLVRATPALLGTPEVKPLLADLAEELAESGEALALADRLDAAVARLACHGSIRAGRRMAGAEMAALLRQMEATPRAATCSHGRPTFVRLGRFELEKLFGRR
jgi:DNA mismatch repair protein MutL